MNTRKRPRPRPPVGRTAPAKAPPAVPARTESVVEGRVVSVDPERSLARVALDKGRHVEARLPQHVSADWLRAAVKLAPVEAAVARLGSDRAILWSIFPGSEHAAVSIDIAIFGRHVSLQASERLEIRCSRGTVVIDEHGNVTLRGKELLSRASGANRIKGGVIRLN